MTFAHPNGAARPARIRILGTAPPPPPPPRRSGRALLVASVIVAGLGVGITLLLRPQISDPPSPEVVAGPTIDLMGLLNLGARTPDTRALRALEVASPDFVSAARIADRRRSVLTEAQTSAPHPVATAQGVSPAPTAADPRPDSAPIEVPGPQAPPDPTSPTTSLEQS